MAKCYRTSSLRKRRQIRGINSIRSVTANVDITSNISGPVFVYLHVHRFVWYILVVIWWYPMMVGTVYNALFLLCAIISGIRSQYSIPDLKFYALSPKGLRVELPGTISIMTCNILYRLDVIEFKFCSFSLVLVRYLLEL